MTTATASPHELVDGYAPPHEDRPLAAYGALSATFGMSLAAALAALRAGSAEDRV